MGTIDNVLPVWMVYAGCALIVLMAAGMCCCIARDIAEMRILWVAAEKGKHKKPRNREPVKKPEGEKADLRRRKKPHGVDLRETDLRTAEAGGIAS